MSNWKSGYFADAGYTYGFYPEASPSRLAWVGLLRGVATPTRDFSYVDLGCGQGFGLCALAALHPESRFVGVDFMPEHIAHARRLAHGAGLSNVEFIEADFLALQHETRFLGEFDYACAHGIATWVAPEVRAALLATAGLWLKPGGLFYCSYNTWPGWLATSPFQHMVLQMQSRLGQGALGLQAASALFAELRGAGALVFDAYPTLKRRMDGLDKSDPNYQLQEYNNQNWQPAHVADMLEQMSRVKLAFLGSATLPDLFDELLPQALRNVIAAQTDTATRETVRDLAVNQGFRRDVYVKGSALLWDQEQQAKLASTRFALIEDPRYKGADAFNFKISAGQIGGDAQVFGQIINKLATGPKALADLLVVGTNTNASEATTALTLSLSMLLNANLIGLCNDSDPHAAVAFNRHVAGQVALGAPYRHLALPDASTAVNMSEFEMKAVALAMEGVEEPSQAMALHLKQQARALVVDGRQIAEVPELKQALDQLLAPYTARKKSMLERLGAMTAPQHKA